MLIRISLIVAILAALGAGTLGYLEVSKQIPALKEQRDTENTAKHKALTQLAATNKAYVVTLAELGKTKQKLADTESELETANAKVEKDAKQIADITEKLTSTTKERDDAKNQLAAYTTIGTPEELVKLSKRYQDALAAIKSGNEEKIVLVRLITRLTNEIAQIESTDPVVKLPPGLRGKITEVDPKWNFVILNIGSDEGVLENGELLVSRDGKLVGKVIVRRLDRNKCVANIVPGWNFGEVLEGDMVSPAHPATPS